MSEKFQEMEQPGPQPSLPHRQRFTAEPDELSEGVLGKDFQFQAKRPNPPGQFTGRPLQPILPTAQATESISHPAKNKGHTPLPPRSPHVPREPLDLPELVYSSGFTSDDGGDLSHRLQGGHASTTTSPSTSRVQSGLDASQISPDSTVKSRPDKVVGLGATSAVESQVPVAEAEERRLVVVKDSQPKDPKQPGSMDGTVLVYDTQIQPQASAADAAASPLSGRQMATQGQVINQAESIKASMKIAPHILRSSEAHRSSSPISSCGDLERPTKRPSTRLASKSPASRAHHVFPRHSTPDGQLLARHRRSQSRASNVSKKRPCVRKPYQHTRGRPGQDRKAIMQELASHWNEYLSAADRDRDQALSELESLQEDVQQQAAELDVTFRKLQSKDQALTQLQAKFQELQEEHEKASADRAEMGKQIETLQKEAKGSTDSTQALRQKNAACRRKVNEAIVEHQNLFKMTQSYCSDLEDRLDVDAANRRAQEEEVQRALEKSQAQRSAMAEMASIAEKEIKTQSALKNETISALQSRIAEQRQALSHVKYLEKSLDCQFRAQQATQQSVDELKAEIAALGRVCDRESDERNLLHVAAEAMNDRLQSISMLVDAVAENIVTKSDAASLVALMREGVVTELQKHFASISSNEKRNEAALASLESKIEASVAGIRHEMAEKFSQMECSAAMPAFPESGLSSQLDQLVADLKTTQATTHNIEQHLGLVVGHGEAEAASLSLKLGEANDQLEKRDAKINDLRRQLQLESEDYQARLDTVLEQQATASAESTSHIEHLVQQKADEISKTLKVDFDTALSEQRRDYEESVREEEARYRTAQNSLKEARSKLEEMRLRQSDSEATKAQLERQNQLVKDLKQRITQYEQRIEVHEKREHRWRQDIEVLDRMRLRIKSLDAHAAKVQILGEGLGNVVKVHDFLNSTGQYLAQEHDWIRAQLEARLETSQAFAGPGAGETSDRNKHQEARALGDAITFDDSSQCLSSSQRDESVVWDDKSQSLGTSQEDWERRRVTVKSPSGSLCSPSAPPSVAQERKRRRAGFETQSILRLAGPTTESQELNHEKRSVTALFDLTSGHSRYFRPAVSRGTPSVAQPTNIGIIQKIKEGLTREHGLGWALPTLADFQTPGSAAESNSTSHIDTAESITSGKGVKLESQG
ncbi:hypothetical protein LIA77_01891 [Sarocladium implicatum]|nr:hypothetical protein LIA77_01891 [Sarocladium implicatum]